MRKITRMSKANLLLAVQRQRTSVMTQCISCTLMCRLYTQNFSAGMLGGDLANSEPWHHFFHDYSRSSAALIFGMLLMFELRGIPSCWMLRTVSLKTPHQKWEHGNDSPSFPEGSDAPAKAPCWQVQNRIWAAQVCLLQMADYLGAVIVERSDSRSSRLSHVFSLTHKSAHWHLDFSHHTASIFCQQWLSSDKTSFYISATN